MEITAGLKKARVWQTDVPRARFHPSGEITALVTAAVPRLARPRRAVVELLVPRGPRIWYGLLGAQFSPHAHGAFTVTVCVTDEPGASVDWSLAGKLDDVHLGIPRTLAQSVMDGVLEAGGASLLGSGELRFDRGAYGLAGSAPLCIKQAARSVVNILADAPETEEQAVRLLQL